MASLRELISGTNMLVVPGAYDCITARAVERAGFEAVYMTGAGCAATLGYPDLGLVTLTEMVENAGRLARSVDIPLISDADTGYGNELNVVRTVREYESRGVAAIHLEDQEIPKKCGHLDQKKIVPAEDFLKKIRAASSARRSPDFLIIARTDALASHGLEEAVRRVNAALEAGADIAFVEAPQTLEQIRDIPRLVNGPCLFNQVHGGKTPEVSPADLQAFGYRITIVPGLLFASVVGICDEILGKLRGATSFPAPYGAGSVEDVFMKVGLREWREIERKLA